MHHREKIDEMECSTGLTDPGMLVLNHHAAVKLYKNFGTLN